MGRPAGPASNIKGNEMTGIFHTLQDFMTFTKGVTYILMVISLMAFTGFWLFLTERDSDATPDEPHDHRKE